LTKLKLITKWEVFLTDGVEVLKNPTAELNRLSYTAIPYIFLERDKLGVTARLLTYFIILSGKRLSDAVV